MQFDLDVLAVGTVAGERQLFRREVDADRDRALLGERDGTLRAAAAEFQDALALEVAEQPVLGFGADVGSVVRDVSRQLRAGLVRGGVAVPRGGVVRRHV